MKLKHFIYLDEYKMYSFASQLFEGLITEFQSSSSEKTTKENEYENKSAQSEKTVFSGTEKYNSEKDFGKDARHFEENRVERKVLMDHLYQKLEDKLVSENLVILQDKQKSIQISSDKPFIKLKGRIFVKNYNSLIEMIKKYPQLTTDLAKSQSLDLIQSFNKTKDELIMQKNNKKDKNGINKIDSQLKELGKKYNEQLEAIISSPPNEFIDSIANILDFGYHDLTEVVLFVDTEAGLDWFSSIINTQFLKESHEQFIRKYSRISLMDFTLVGTLIHDTNTSKREDVKSNIKTQKQESIIAFVDVMMQTIMGIDDALYSPESKIQIDPIAIYLDVL